MKKIFSDPFIWFKLLAILTFVAFLLRGLKTIRWKIFARVFISAACLLAALVLSPYSASIRLIRFIASALVVAAIAVIVIDIFSGLFLKVRRKVSTGRSSTIPLPDYLMEICSAMEILASQRTGALIVLKRKDKLEEYTSNAIPFDAQIKSEILVALFSATSPVHDGAVIVVNGRIKGVKAILSLKTEGNVPMGIGTRHRSALGITEKTDAIALVVSEERGEMSIAYQGSLVKIDSLKGLYRLIKTASRGKNIMSS
ncbi:MAG: DNA integrity scanning protein DisA nucleotide-binding domain protein [Candidatus Omnitrophica bacterium]|nr:DNA integrity scanning protein DisA nucleotide-binding domain protein [Candidatus Omnitrophota bacterium]